MKISYQVSLFQKILVIKNVVKEVFLYNYCTPQRIFSEGMKSYFIGKISEVSPDKKKILCVS